MNLRAPPRLEGPWWKSWLAVFGRRNMLDRVAEQLGVERKRYLLFFRESNESLRKRCVKVLRGLI